ncbi:MAG: hypothetical protein ACR2MK_09665 [Solirubrobacteraceae bacterium]
MSTAGLLLAFVLAGCGNSSLSAGQLRTAARRICAVAQRQTERIPTPTEPSQGAGYLRRGVAALAPEVAALRRLTPPSDLASGYRDALTDTGAEVQALRRALNGLRAGNDPVVAIKTLQQELAPLEPRAEGAWRSLDIAACVGA